MKIFLIIILSYSALVSFGQLSIKGKVKDRQQYLPSVNVLLFDKDSIMIDGTITNTSGEFLFEQVLTGTYFISASMVGYVTFLSHTISMLDDHVVVPEMTLEEEIIELDLITIRQEKERFTQRSDRLVINLEGSAASSGNTILEVLQKSPGIVVNRQDNSVTMNGRSGVRIMINEKLMQVPLDVVIQMLEGMSASNIKEIELIATPPSKYDAEGNAGIIHIVTKKNEDFGSRGSIGLTLGYRWAENLGGNFNFSHRNKRFAYSIEYAVLRNHNLHNLNIRRQSFENNYTPKIDVHGRRENVTTQQNVSGGFEWQLTPQTTLHAGFTGYRRNWSMDALTRDVNSVTLDSIVNTNMNVSQSNIWDSATGSVSVNSKINPRSEIRLGLDYLYYHNDNPSTYNNEIFFEKANELSKTDLQKTTPIKFIIAKADYQYEVSPNLTWEAGIKAVVSRFNNEVLVRHQVNDVWKIDPEYTSHSTLREQLGAVYVSTKWEPGRQWLINGGLRYEYTGTSIGKSTDENLIRREYGYLFPSLSVQKKLEDEKDFHFAYMRRISRPTYNDIASYSAFWSPNTFTAENTSLWPAVSNGWRAGYHIRQWSVSVQYTNVKNEITSLQPEVERASNKLTYRSQNLKDLNTLSLSNFYSVPVASWWVLQSSVTVQYQVAQTSHLEQDMKLSAYGLNINIVTLLKLPHDISIEISGNYQSKSLTGMSYYLPVGSLNAGIQKNLKKNGTIRLAMDDILYTNNWRIKTYSPENNVDLYFRYDWHNQFVRLTYTRSLGNQKMNSIKSKSGAEEERKRISN